MKNLLFIALILIAGGVSYTAWYFFIQSDIVAVDNEVSFADYAANNRNFSYTDLPVETGFVPDQIPPLDTIFPQPLSADFRTVLDAVYLDSYIISSCADGGTALMLTARVSEDKEINDYEESMRILAEWDPYILRDVGILLYPDELIQQVPVLRFENIAGGSVRQSDFELNGTQRSLFYSSVLNYMVYAPSFNCLESLIRSIYAPEHH